MSTPLDLARNALLRAVAKLPARERIDVKARIERAESGPEAVRPLERAGLSRAMLAEVQTRTCSTSPQWTAAKVFHRVWIASLRWDRAYAEAARERSAAA